MSEPITLAPKSSWRQRAFLIGLAAIGLFLLTAALSLWLPPAVDWRLFFRPAALQLLHGRSPYDITGFPSPPWALLPMLPLALLPEHIGRALFLLLNFAAFTYVAYRLGAKPLAMAFFLLSPPVLHSLLNGNVDAMVLLGFILPPPVGLFFLAIKPQIGAAVAFYWLIESWRQKGAPEVIRVFAPVTIALLASFLLFGLWPLRWSQEVDQWWNASAWPLSIPVGLGLLVAAIRQRRMELAMAASPCLSPYVLLHAWVGALAAILPLTAETVAAVIGLWLLVISLLAGS